jgi:hypothetical protein
MDRRMPSRDADAEQRWSIPPPILTLVHLGAVPA